jgi:glycosyltransferase involved in cell wall biosynthesis
MLSESSNKSTEPSLSFVIPAFNEERYIAQTILAVHELVPPLAYEILVVDNCSTDSTREIAAGLNATVLQKGGGTIGGLRNLGVKAATGVIIVFLDADVIITRDWAARIPTAIQLLMAEPSTVTGSMCGVPTDASWLERYWFAPRQKASHIGSGHMVITRQFFNELGGFDERIATGEDYELSRRAVDRSGRILSDSLLRVEHLGFPRTVLAFLQRESWHGVGDYASLSTFFRSKVAVAAVSFAILHTIVLAGLLIGELWIALAALLAIISLCLVSSYRQYRYESIKLTLLNSGMFWFYYLGRVLAIVRRLAGMYSRGSR